MSGALTLCETQLKDSQDNHRHELSKLTKVHKLELESLGHEKSTLFDRFQRLEQEVALLNTDLNYKTKESVDQQAQIELLLRREASLESAIQTTVSVQAKSLLRLESIL